MNIIFNILFICASSFTNLPRRTKSCQTPHYNFFELKKMSAIFQIEVLSITHLSDHESLITFEAQSETSEILEAFATPTQKLRTSFRKKFLIKKGAPL